jgi:hypothetical protein
VWYEFVCPASGFCMGNSLSDGAPPQPRGAPLLDG